MRNQSKPIDLRTAILFTGIDHFKKQRCILPNHLRQGHVCSRGARGARQLINNGDYWHVEVARESWQKIAARIIGNTSAARHA
jgi:hypothetical protein